MKRFDGLRHPLLYVLAAAAALAGALLAGCGAGSGTAAVTPAARAATGSATLRIKWPARSATRLIPVASNSILVTLTLNGATVAAQVATRPTDGTLTSTLTFPALPIGALGVTAIATPDTNLNPAQPTLHSTPQASGTGVITIAANSSATLTITMDSTITSLKIVPSGLLYLQIGNSEALNVEALDSAGDMVLVSQATIQWQINNTVIATAAPDTADTGVTVTGVTSGNTTLTVQETESGQIATIPVEVRGPLAGVQITTVTPSITVGGEMYFDYVGVDASGNVIPNANLGSATWTSSNATIASIVSSTGLCTANSVGTAQGAQTATVTITLTVSGFTNTQVLTVNAGPAGQTEGSSPLLSPATVSLNLNTAQEFTAWTFTPTSGTNNHSGTSFQIVIPTDAVPGSSFGTLTQTNKGTCIYTSPATDPSVNNNGSITTVQQIQIQASDGAPVATVTLLQ